MSKKVLKSANSKTEPTPSFWWQDNGNIDAVREITRRKTEKKRRNAAKGNTIDIPKGEITKISLNEFTSAKAAGAVEKFLERELYGRRKRARDTNDRNDRKIGGHRKK